MKRYKLLLIELSFLLLIVGCEKRLEPEDCLGVIGGEAVEDACGNCFDENNPYIQGDRLLQWPIDCIPGNDCDLGHADINKDDLLSYHQLLQKVPISDELISFATTLVKSTRPGEGSSEMVQRFVRYGAGTRASIFLTIAARTRAALLGHETPSKKDVRAVAKTVLRHRLICNFQAEAQGITSDQIIESLLERI